MKKTKKETCKKSLEKIKEINDNDITPNNIDNLGKLIDIVKDIKEVEDMYGNYGRGSYGEYGRRPGYDSYGEYGRDSYGRRGYDTKYRGYDKINEMSNEYGRYIESRDRYGAGEETDKSFHYMLKSLEDFIQVLHEEAETEPQRQMLRETIQKSMR